MEPPLIDLKLSPKTRLLGMKCCVGLMIFVFALCALQVYLNLKSIQYSTIGLRLDAEAPAQKNFERILRREADISLNCHMIQLQLVIMAAQLMGIGSMAYCLGKHSQPHETPETRG